jgi:hypothetical protein
MKRLIVSAFPIVAAARTTQTMPMSTTTTASPVIPVGSSTGLWQQHDHRAEQTIGEQPDQPQLPSRPRAHGGHSVSLQAMADDEQGRIERR